MTAMDDARTQHARTPVYSHDDWTASLNALVGVGLSREAVLIYSELATLSGCLPHQIVAKMATGAVTSEHLPALRAGAAEIARLRLERDRLQDDLDTPPREHTGRKPGGRPS